MFQYFHSRNFNRYAFMFIQFPQAPLRRQSFMRENPNIPLPPKPSTTRWGTWIDAAIYYADNFEVVRSVVNSFDPEESEAISAAQQLMRLSNIKRELAFIKTNYSCFSTALTSIQAQGVSLSAAIEKFLAVGAQLDGTQHAAVRQKFDTIIRKNKGLAILRKISAILQGIDTDDTEPSDFINNLSPSELSAYAYAPVTSCDVERTFSSFKYIFSDRRRSFTLENLKQHLVIYCNEF